MLGLDADDRLELDGVLSMCVTYFRSEFDSSAGNAICFRADFDVDSRMTVGGTEASLASAHLAAHRHHLSPGLRPGNPY